MTDAALQVGGIDAEAGGEVGSGGATGIGGGQVAGRDAGAAGAGGTDPDGRQDAGGSRSSPDASSRRVGNITTREKADPTGLTFSDHWDQLTPEHAGVWGNVQRTPGGAFNWSALDALYQYTVQKGIAFDEHCFIYGSWQPGQPTGTIGEADVQAWMQAFCERYPKTRTIDVVSEPPPHSTVYYANNIGGGTNGDWKWIANAFRWARQACPDAVLLLSDYNIVEKADENQRFIGIVNTVRNAGAPIDAIGVEVFNTADQPTSTVRTLLDKLHADTGLPVYVTGFSVSRKEDTAQLQVYQSLFQLFWQTAYVRGITLWGWIYDEDTSLPYSGLVRAGTSRPAMKWLMDLLGRPSP